MTPAASGALKRAAGLALVAMWLCEEVKLLTGWAVASWAGAAAFLAYFAAAICVSRPLQRMIILAVTATAIGLALAYRLPEALRTGVYAAVLFAAFLSTMQMMRVALETSPLVGEMRQHFATLTSGQQHDSALLRTHLMASALAAGALAVVAPLLGRDDPAVRRREFAQGALQGIGLAVLWSPFFVAMAVSTRFAPGVALGSAVLSGFVLAAIGLVLSHVMYGGAGILASLASMRRTVIEVAVLSAAIVLANRVWGLSSLEAVVLGIPLLSMAIARRDLRTDAPLVARRWFASLESIAVEALVVGTALVLGEVVNALLVQGIVAIPHGAETWPVPVLIALPALVMLGTSLMGLHPIVSASCLLPVLMSIEKLHGLVSIGAVLVGWMLCVILSVFVVPVMYAGTVFDIRHGELVRGRNLRFCVFFTPLALGYLWALNLALQR